MYDLYAYQRAWNTVISVSFMGVSLGVSLGVSMFNIDEMNSTITYALIFNFPMATLYLTLQILHFLRIPKNFMARLELPQLALNTWNYNSFLSLSNMQSQSLILIKDELRR